MKQTSDLLMVMSNLYTLQQGSLVMSPKRMFPATPLVKLGGDFKKVSSFLSRFGSIPDMLELDHLTVSGDVTFGRGGRNFEQYHSINNFILIFSKFARDSDNHC